MDQVQIEIITGNDGNSAEIEEPAGAAVGEAFNAHEGSNDRNSAEIEKPGLSAVLRELENAQNRFKKADSGSQPSDEDEVQVNGSEYSVIRRIWTLAKVKGLKATKANMWKVAFEHYSEQLRTSENLIDRRKEEMRSIKNEIYQVLGFFSAFQSLLITAAAQSILLRCNNVGFILALSAFATAVAVFGIWQKITAMEELRFDNISIERGMEVINSYLSYLRRNGINSDLLTLDGWSEAERNSCTPWKKILVSYGTWLVVSVLAFGGLCMVAMRQIVCNPGHSLPSN